MEFFSQKENKWQFSSVFKKYFHNQNVFFFQDIQSGTVITDEAFEKFKNCLNGLVAPVSKILYLFISCLQFCVSLTCYFLAEEMVAYLLMGTYVLQIEVFKVMLGAFFKLWGQQRQGRCQLKKERNV